jgi:hypothetical protein
MAPEAYVLIAGILGGLIGFASSYLTTMLTLRFQEAKRKEERDWYLADQQRSIRSEILNRRYDEAEALVTVGMENTLKIAKLVHSVAKSRNMETKKNRQAELFQLSEEWSQVQEFDKLHTIVHAIGDSQLIDHLIDLHVNYTSFLEWLEKSIIADLVLDETLPITRSKLNKVYEFRMEALDFFGRFYERLDQLRSGKEPEKKSSRQKISALQNTANREPGPSA